MKLKTLNNRHACKITVNYTYRTKCAFTLGQEAHASDSARCEY